MRAQQKGKSFFTNIIKHVGDLGYEWAYLPLEDGRRDWTWRMMAIIENDYRMIDDDQETAQLRLLLGEKKNLIIIFLA